MGEDRILSSYYRTCQNLRTHVYRDLEGESCYRDFVYSGIEHEHRALVLLTIRCHFNFSAFLHAADIAVKTAGAVNTPKIRVYFASPAFLTLLRLPPALR